MRILVTGAGGFLGRKLISLLKGHEVVVTDLDSSRLPAGSNIEPIAGDICDSNLRDACFSSPIDTVVHLATIPGGAAEQNPERAWRVNVEATRHLAEATIAQGNRPRFIFASSIAVYGSRLRNPIDDTSLPAPELLYGGHKLMMEQWLATRSRRGELDALSLRIAGAVARPRGESGMKSAFLSQVFHALAAGRSFTMPVSADATSWISSADAIADNFAYAVDSKKLPGNSGEAILLPALRVRMSDLVSEISRQAGTDPAAVTFASQPQLEAVFGSHPELNTQRSIGLGYKGDFTLSRLVSAALQEAF